MSRPSSKKKEAARLLTKFKKEYDRIWREEDVKERSSMKLCNDFWMNNIILDKEVREEIVKLVEKESIDLKIVFANLIFGQFECPQKRWFLGNEESTLLLPRQPCNNFGYFISTLDQGVVLETTFIQMLHLLPRLTNVRKMFISNKGALVRIVGTEEQNMEDILIECMADLSVSVSTIEHDTVLDKKFKPVERRNKFSHRGTLIELKDGKLMSEKEIKIYLNDREMSQKIVQFQIEHGGDQILLLFETFFMASGVIKKIDAKLIINCFELRGSYGTGKFAVSPDFQLLLRETAINKNVQSLTVPNHLERLRDMIEIIEDHQRKLYFKEDIELAPNSANLLNFMCKDCRILLLMHEQFNYDPAPEFFLSPFEEVAYNYQFYRHQIREEEKCEKASAKQGTKCDHSKGVCQSMEILLNLCNWIVEKGDKGKDNVEKELINIISRMLEIYSVAVVLNKESNIPVCLKERCYEHNGFVSNPIDYYPLGSWLVYLPVEELGFAVDCVSEEVLAKFYEDFQKIGETMTTVLEKRPELVLFGAQKTLIPLQLVRDFAKWYEVEHFNRMTENE